MLATALAVCACHQGRRVRFTTLAALANELQEAEGNRELARVVGRYARTELSVCDELGYLALPDGAAELVFQVLSERHERGSLIVTTNLPFGEWTKVFPDPRLAKAVVDRLTHRAHIIDTGNECWRFRHGLERQHARKSMTPAPKARPRLSPLSPSPYGLGPRDDSRRLPYTGIRQHQHQQQPTPGGATSSHRAGASASHRFHADGASGTVPNLEADSVPAATARQAGRQGATGGSTGRDRRIGRADRRIGRARQTDRLGATTSPIDGRSSHLLGGGATGWIGSRSWLDAADGHSQRPGRAPRCVPARCRAPDPPTRCRVRRSNLGPPPTQARVARLRLSPLRPRQADRRFLESRHPDVHAPTFRAQRPRDDLPVPDVARWPSGQPRRMATPRDRRDGSGNLSSLLGYRGGVSWTGVDRANGARQNRPSETTQPPTRSPAILGGARNAARRQRALTCPAFPSQLAHHVGSGNATNALVSPAMSANAPDFASFVLPRSGATGALAKRALGGCRDMSRYQFSSGFSMHESSKKSANSELRSGRLARTSITH